MIIGLQIVSILFSFGMIYFAVLAYKKRELGTVETISWATLWIGTSIIVIFPELLRSLSMRFLVTRVFDVMVVGGFLLVLSLVSSAYLRTKRSEKKLEELIRADAIKNVKNRAKK